jgi:hypothetical protein
MSRLFGWSYPPGCSGPPDYPDPPKESQEIQEILEDYSNLPPHIIDRIIYIVDELCVKASQCPECERRREDEMFHQWEEMKKLEESS